MNRIQRSRKELNLNVSDRITVIYEGAEPVTAAIVRFADYVAGETLATRWKQAIPAPARSRRRSTITGLAIESKWRGECGEIAANKKAAIAA